MFPWLAYYHNSLVEFAMNIGLATSILKTFWYHSWVGYVLFWSLNPLICVISCLKHKEWGKMVRKRTGSTVLALWYWQYICCHAGILEMQIGLFLRSLIWNTDMERHFFQHPSWTVHPTGILLFYYFFRGTREIFDCNRDTIVNQQFPNFFYYFFQFFNFLYPLFPLGKSEPPCCPSEFELKLFFGT